MCHPSPAMSPPCLADTRTHRPPTAHPAPAARPAASGRALAATPGLPRRPTGRSPADPSEPRTSGTVADRGRTSGPPAGPQGPMSSAEHRPAWGTRPPSDTARTLARARHGTGRCGGLSAAPARRGGREAVRPKRGPACVVNQAGGLERRGIGSARGVEGMRQGDQDLLQHGRLSWPLCASAITRRRSRCGAPPAGAPLKRRRLPRSARPRPPRSPAAARGDGGPTPSIQAATASTRPPSARRAPARPRRSPGCRRTTPPPATDRAPRSPPRPSAGR
jgi:hypothetical protein